MAAATAAEILTDLIRFDSVSSRSNLPIIAWIESYLSERGVSSTRVPDETGEKANLIATIGPAEVPGYVLSGHTDVVPVEGQDWSVDPFGGGALRGRRHVVEEQGEAAQPLQEDQHGQEHDHAHDDLLDLLLPCDGHGLASSHVGVGFRAAACAAGTCRDA